MGTGTKLGGNAIWGQARSWVDTPGVRNPVHGSMSDSNAMRRPDRRNRVLENRRLYPDLLPLVAAMLSFVEYCLKSPVH